MVFILKQTELINIFWFRRDLRLQDNAGLYSVQKLGKTIQPIFIFDTNILDQLDKHDSRVSFIHKELGLIDDQLRDKGSSLKVFHGDPIDAFKSLIKRHKVQAVYTNTDYEPYAKNRDSAVANFLEEHNIEFHSVKDHVVFEKHEITKADGLPYTVFTPYKRKWLEKFNETKLKSYPTSSFDNYNPSDNKNRLPSLKKLGFELGPFEIPSKEVKQSTIKKYDTQRDFPAIDGTSKLGIHFRFGTISIREKVKKAAKLNDVYLSELIWRDFYSQILFHFPKVVTESFRAKYDKIVWRNNEKDFEFWCQGKTGYPLVDAGMRELNATGFMHNRVRMVVASFLTKHLLIDWRWGEAYFAEKLLDFDLASNNGGWQWAAGCGTDAAPYFRIFNPTSQMQKFDKNQVYIKKWIPEFGTDKYPAPIVDHKMARERCLTVYKSALS